MSFAEGHGGASERALQDTLLRLIAQSRLLRETASEGEPGAGSVINHLLNERERLIQNLESAKPSSDASTHALFDKLEREDARTLARLETWREQLKADLVNLTESRSALKGYARPAGPKVRLFDREL